MGTFASATRTTAINAARDAAINAVAATLNNGTLRIYAGTPPANADGALSGTTLLAITLTQGVINTVIAGLWWVITGRGIAPDPDEAFSSRVGRYAMQGSKWALTAERLIDGIFGRGHCRESAANHTRGCD